MDTQQNNIAPLARFPEEWLALLASWNVRPFAAKQIFQWIYKHGKCNALEMSNLSQSLREKLHAAGLKNDWDIEKVHASADGTRKLLVKLADEARIETVLLPAVSGNAPRAIAEDADACAADDDDADGSEDVLGSTVRVTQCISTQVGCAMACQFCASGVAGLKRNLGADEIVGQVLLGRSLLQEQERLRNVVLMGMGEPLHNYDATARALRLLSHRDGLDLSLRRITVSTSGLVPEIDRLGQEFGGQIQLAISLHATNDKTRSAIMPINRKYPLAELMSALQRYPLPKRRRFTIEYTLIAEKNDSVQEAKALAKLLRPIPVKINLIPMNPVQGSQFFPPAHERVFEFQRVLCDAGYSCFIRKRRGDDVSAACGQLVLLGAKPKVKGFR